MHLNFQNDPRDLNLSVGARLQENILKVFFFVFVFFFCFFF